MATLNFTPSTLIQVIDNLLSEIGEIILTGEISSINISAGKWVFIDIIDAKSSVSCFLPLSRYHQDLEIGNKVEFLVGAKLTNKAKFSLTVYQYLKLLDTDKLALKRADDYQKIAKLGYLDPDRKKTLSKYPEKIALITADNSAALADFIKVLTLRNTTPVIDFYPSAVQGVIALASLKKILAKVTKNSQYDVVVLIRGGGSKDDLSVFDEYDLATLIAKSRVPVLVGIGHENDLSLTELVADLRASTPTDAANLVSGPILDLITSYQAKFNNHVNYRQSQLKVLQDFLNSYHRSIINAKTSLFKQAHFQLKHYQNLINLYNPQNILSRGYSIIRINNRIIKDAKLLDTKGDLSIQFRDDTLELEYVKKD